MTITLQLLQIIGLLAGFVLFLGGLYWMGKRNLFPLQQAAEARLAAATSQLVEVQKEQAAVYVEQVTQLKAENTLLRARVTVLENDVQTLKTSGDGKDDKNALLSAKLANKEIALEAAQKEIERLKRQAHRRTDVSPLSGRARRGGHAPPPPEGMPPP